jgi:hypothetical protein
MATQVRSAPALRPYLAAVFLCVNGRCGKSEPRPAPATGILADLAANGRPQ